MTYEFIINPVTNRKVSIYSKKGVSIIKHYLNQSGGNNQIGGVNCSIRRKTVTPLCDDEDECHWIKGKGCRLKSRGSSSRGSSSRGSSSRGSSSKRKGRGRPSYKTLQKEADDYYGEYDSDAHNFGANTIDDLTNMDLRRKKFRHCSDIEKGDVRTCLSSREKNKLHRGKPCYYEQNGRRCRTGSKDKLRESRRKNANESLKSRRRKGFTKSLLREAAMRHTRKDGTTYNDDEYFPKYD